MVKRMTKDEATKEARIAALLHGGTWYVVHVAATEYSFVEKSAYRQKMGRVSRQYTPESVRTTTLFDDLDPNTQPDTHTGVMADERETAQWYMSGGISQDDAKKLLAAEVPDAEKRCYKFGSLAAWQPLPTEAKDALRRKLAQVRADSERYEREVLGRQPTGDEPECCNPASATSEANREQDQRDQMTKYQTDAIRPYLAALAPKLEIHQGDLIPLGLGHDEDRAIAAVITTVGDIIGVAADNGYKLTEAQALEVLEAQGRRIADALLYDWADMVWAACDNDIVERGVEMTEEEKDDRDGIPSTRQD